VPMERQQLTLALDALGGGEQDGAAPSLPFPPVADGGPPFDDDGRFFEPWWPGTPAFLRREGDQLEMRTQHLCDPLQAFPELRSLLPSLAAERLIIEGTLLALDRDGRPDAALLRRRLSGRHAPEDPAEGAFVAADLPWLEGRSLAREPFVERRRRLAQLLADSSHGVLGRGVVGEGRMLARAAARMGLLAISARRLDARWGSGRGGDERLRLTVEEQPIGPTRPFLVLIERLPLEDHD
jgi:bifunctional non-homologous end joining protein LigD